MLFKNIKSSYLLHKSYKIIINNYQPELINRNLSYFSNKKNTSNK